MNEQNAKDRAESLIRHLGDGWTPLAVQSNVDADHYVPAALHVSRLNVARHEPTDTWFAHIGLMTTIGNTSPPSAIRIDIRSDPNANPRRAIVECVDRLRRALSGMTEQLDQMGNLSAKMAELEKM